MQCLYSVSSVAGSDDYMFWVVSFEFRVKDVGCVYRV